MVTTAARTLARWVTAVLVIAAAVLLLGAPSALAQPEDPPADPAAVPAEQEDPGFFDACDTFTDSIDLLPGFITGPACKAATVAMDPSGAAGAATSWVAAGAVGEAAEAFLEGFGQAINLMFTWWLNIPLPDLANPESVGAFHAYLYWINASLVAVSIAVSMVRLAFATASARNERATESAKMLTRTVFASATFAPALVAMHAGSVAMGRWIVDDAAGGNISGVLKNLTDVSNVSADLSAGLMFIFGLLGILGALVQALFVVIQYALLICVTGFLPTAAAGSGTVPGDQAYKKMIGFAIATVLFPLFSACVYALALWSAGSDDAMSRLCGMALLALSCLCLPVLLRLIMPAVAASGGASGASALAAIGVGTGAAAGVAMKAASSSGSGGGGSSTTPATGGRSGDAPTGAQATPPSGGGGAAGRGGASGSAGAAGASGASASGASAAGGAAGGAAAAAGPVGAAAAGAKQATAVIGKGVQAVESATGAASGDGHRDGHGSGGRSG
ncbi:hypothetical protein [Rhodococcus sp. 077-4]|uniref:hypothetical protein n=1 Tax=Rhodococcus sp. 077-4 TaxID=2789271 RepID=UPI0039F47015